MFGGVAILSMESGRMVELDLIKLGRIGEKEKKKRKKKLRCETESKKRWFQERPYTSFIWVCVQDMCKKGARMSKGEKSADPKY